MSWVRVPSSTPISLQLTCGPLAQLVEQETLNLLVVGSTPTRPTIFPCAQARRFHAPVVRAKMPMWAKVAELVDALDLGSSGDNRAGSSPAFRTIARNAKPPVACSPSSSTRCVVLQTI